MTTTLTAPEQLAATQQHVDLNEKAYAALGAYVELAKQGKPAEAWRARSRYFALKAQMVARGGVA